MLGRLEPSGMHPVRAAAGPSARRFRVAGGEAGKRTLDLVLAGLGLVLAAPLLVAVVAAIKLGDGGPVLYRQARAGRHARPFTLLKFRTMRVGAVRAVPCQGPRPPQAVAGDPRVTAVGRWLRRSSLDELPQLWNVLRGEMSLVGPRPHALGHAAYYAARVPAYRLRHAVKPGLTGWAQVNGLRGPTPTAACMAARVRFDLEYVARRSFAFDLRIVAATALCLAHPNAH